MIYFFTIEVKFPIATQIPTSKVKYSKINKETRIESLFESQKEATLKDS